LSVSFSEEITLFLLVAFAGLSVLSVCLTKGVDAKLAELKQSEEICHKRLCKGLACGWEA
jgi:hypothetical protein